MYLVYSGELKITKNENGVEKELIRVREGDYFGERALITNEVRAASVTAMTNCTLLKLDRNAFSLLLGPLEDIMKKKVESYNAGTPAAGSGASAGVAAASAATAAAAAAPSEKIDFNDLKAVATLGKGSFGHVQLVQHKKTGVTYALKAVNKAQIVQTGQQGHVLSEKRVMCMMASARKQQQSLCDGVVIRSSRSLFVSSSFASPPFPLLQNHPFLVKLHATYKDKNRLFFLLGQSSTGTALRWMM
jgi:hypothetical protein